MIEYLAASDLKLANQQWLWLAITLGAAGAVITIVSYLKSHLKGIWLVLAATLKIAAFALLAIALLEPVWVDKFARNGANDLVFLTDNSKGLSIGDRGSSLQKVLKHDQPDSPPEWMAELEELFRVQTYQFDRRLKRVDDYSELNFEGNASSLLTSLSSLRNRYEKRPLAGTVLFTDGNATDSASIDAVLKNLARIKNEGETPLPIYPVLVGQTLPDVVDLSIRDIQTSQSSFEDAPLSIAIQAEARGKFERGVEVYVIDDKGKEVATEPVVFDDSSIRKGSVRLKVAGVTPGISFYRVGIRAISGENYDPPEELTQENNERVVSVDRGRGPYRVLYMSGRPKWEYKFLRRAISEDAEVDLVSLLRIAKREPKFEWRGRTGESGNPLFRGFGKDIPEETQKYDEPVFIRLNTKDEEELRDGFPRDAETLYSNYRAIIFDDLESEALSASQQNLIENFVSKRGGTVIMLGGQESYSGGDWVNTPISRLLPVYMDRLDTEGAAQFATFNLSREGWLEPWMRLRDSQDEETSRLAYMPEFFSINRIPSDQTRGQSTRDRDR